MNETVQASIDAQLLTLSRLVEPTTGELGYGLDLSCVTDLSPTLAEVDPASADAIVEAVTRRYITPRGRLPDDADYGLDVRAHVNRGATERDLRALSGALRGEAQKDDRVLEASVQLAAALQDPTIRARVVVTPADPELQPFEFTFAVTDGDVLRGTIRA